MLHKTYEVFENAGLPAKCTRQRQSRKPLPEHTCIRETDSPDRKSRTAIITVVIVAQVSLTPACVTHTQRTFARSYDRLTLTFAERSTLTPLQRKIWKSCRESAKPWQSGLLLIVSNTVRFRRPEHLMMVRGISEQKFRAIRSRLRSNNRAIVQQQLVCVRTRTLATPSVII